MKNKTCYICGQPATSFEHAPAQCFFPEYKRKGKELIKVPSCAKHNEDTSQYDNYVRGFITTFCDNNQVGFEQFKNKSLKSFEQNKKWIHEAKSLCYNGQQMDAIKLDRDIFNFIIKRIADAIFFNKYNSHRNRELIIVTDCLKGKESECDELGKMLCVFKSKMPEKIYYEGNVQDVFKFAFVSTNSKNTNNKSLVMIFHEGFEIWIIPKTNTNTPKLDYPNKMLQ
jgi:hypothetical protein